VHRARLSFALLLALPLIACAKETPPVPAPEPKAPAKAEASVVSAKLAAPPAATGEVAPAKTVELAAGSADASPSAAPSVIAKLVEPKAKDEAPLDKAKAKEPPAAAKAGAGSAGITFPTPKNGVLGAAASDKILKAGATPIVTLLDAGAEPRADLGYALTKGSAQKLSMGMDMTMAMKMGQKAMPPMTIPHMVVLLDMHTTDQSAAGEWKIDSKLTGLTIESKGAGDKPLADAMRPQVEGLKGLGIGYWVNAKGQVHDTKIDVPAGLPPAAQQMIQGMNQSFEAMVVPLPREAVGNGARWQVVSRLSSSGADLLQSAMYTLRSRSGKKATVEVTLTQLAADEIIKVPGAPAGVSAKVKSFNSGGSGVQQLDTLAVAPEGGAMQIKTSMTIAVQDGAASDDTSVDTVTSVQMKRP
jgi:hypothetical protein